MYLYTKYHRDSSYVTPLEGFYLSNALLYLSIFVSIYIQVIL
jgi:hypothetical protein